MNRFRYPAVMTLALLTAFAPVRADAQQMAGPSDSAGAHGAVFLPVRLKPDTTIGLGSLRLEAAVVRSVRLQADRQPVQRLRDSQSTGNARSERGPARIVLGALVGAAGGLFAGGYLGAKIEGNRCHCDDPGLQGALIGAPVGAVAGGILGGLYLF